MVQITAIVRREKEEEIMRKVEEFNPIHVTSCFVEGCGIEEGVLKYVEDGQDVVMLIPKAKIETVIEDENEDTLINEIISICRTGIVGDGKIFVEKVLEGVV